MLLGTPGYMSPEQVRGEDLDARSDQFSFCVALYEALHRVLPFDAPTFDEYALRVVQGRRRPPSPTPDIPVVVERALNRGLSTDPAARFPSMQALIAALQEGLHPETETVATRLLSRRLGVLHVAIVAMAIVVAGLLGLRVAGETMFPTIIIAALLVFLRSLVSFAFRKQMGQHPRYQRLNFLFFVVTGYMLVGRVIGYFAGLSRSQYVSIEMVSLGAMMLVASTLVKRPLGWLAAASIVCSALMQVWPAARPHIVSIYFPMLAVSALILMIGVRADPPDPSR